MDSPREIKATLAQQKETLLAAKARKGQKATNKESRQAIALGYFRRSQMMNAPQQKRQLRTCFINFAYPPSTTPLRDLKPIRLSELRLEMHHAGRVLFVRKFTECVRYVSVQAGVEDEVGDVDHLALYNSDPKLRPAQALPRNAVFAVKEPFYKVSASGTYLIRVDHPSDLLELPATHDSIPPALLPRLVELDKSAAAYKLDGNKAYKAKEYRHALEHYTQGIKVCGDGDEHLRSDLLRNRSIVNLYLDRYEPAAADALASISQTTDLGDAARRNNSKAYYRAGCAFYHLENFKEALDRFHEAVALLPEDADCAREIGRAESRLREQTRGTYDFAAISTGASSKHNRLHRASFLAQVEVREAREKGRGLFATTDLKAGELILCEKAFTVSFSSDSEAEIYTVLNLNTNSGVLGTQATLTFNLIQKMLHNPAAATRFFGLFDGGYTPKGELREVDGVTVIDTFRAAAIGEYNVFGCPAVRSSDESQTRKSASDPYSASGVWITASYINHDCAGNASRSFIGDLMIVTATKDIAKGTEITMPYRAAEGDNTKTQEALKKGWKFKCGCYICTAEANTGGSQASRRRQLVAEAEALMQTYRLSATFRPSKGIIAKAQKLYNQLEATYNKTLFERIPRLGLIDLGLWLLNVQPPNSNTKHVIDRALEILHNCGYLVEVKGKQVNVDYSHCFLHSAAVDAAVHAAHASYFKGDVVIGKQFEAFAKRLYATRFGELRGYAERYGDRS